MTLYCERSGSGSPTLVLLHGLAGNGAIWQPFLHKFQGRWPGQILVPDLRGHGRSPHGRHYGFGQFAGDVADLLAPGERVYFVGHSLGAIVSLLLASGWYELTVEAVLGFSIKLAWTAPEIEKVHSLAKNPVRWFESRNEAASRFLRLSGLAGLVPENADVVSAGVREENGRWRLAADPWSFSTTLPPSETFFHSAKAPVMLACGANDPMVKIGVLRTFDPQATELPGLGHNLHVEAPQVLADLVSKLLCARLVQGQSSASGKA